MPDLFQPATTSRAKCRGCGRTIKAGELRFGEALPNPYAEGETFHWFHPTCAACMRPEKFLEALKSTTSVPDREWLEKAAEKGVAFPRLVRLSHAERSKSGKARCRSCREPIAGGVLRFALQMFEEGRMSPMGFIHVECTNAYFGTTDLLDRVKKLSPDLDDAAFAEVAERLAHQREAAPDEQREDARDLEGPDVAKANPSPDEGDEKRANEG